MRVVIPASSPVACICEGGAETEIMNILLDHNLLCFSREQMIDENVIPRTSVKEFERRYLRTEYDEKVVIVRVIDSRNEKFNLSKVYDIRLRRSM